MHFIVSKKGLQRSKSHNAVNEQIRITPVRVISAEGEQLGIMPTEQALTAAREAGLDLVEVAPNERPPVCRIMDFGKFKYQQKKRQHKSQAHHSKIKEIRVRPKTGDHDIEVKVSRAREFLAHKDKVIVSVVFRGREVGPRRGRAARHQADVDQPGRRRQGRIAAQPARPAHHLHPGAEVGLGPFGSRCKHRRLKATVDMASGEEIAAG